MDRGRSARSVSRSRSRRDERRQSLQSSHESLAGNISPGRHHEGHHRNRRESSGGGFFRNLFGRRDQHQHQQLPGDAGSSPLQPSPQPPASSSPGSRFRSIFNISPQKKKKNSRNANSPPHARGPVDELQVKELQHRVQLLTAELEGYEKVKSQLLVEQRLAEEWKEKWNYQNFKLNLMVDMMVLRVLELEQPAAAQLP